MKAKKILKGAVLSVFAALVITSGVFAVNYADCTGEPGKKFPNITISEDDDFPVRCTAVKGEDDEYITFYAKTSADCASASTLVSNPDGCKGSDMNEMIKPKHGTAMNPIVTKDNKNVASKPVDGVLIGGEKNEAQPVEVERVAHEVETPKRTKRQLKVK